MSWVVPQASRTEVLGAPRPRFGALPARLAAVALGVPEGARVADVGTDHGLLPAALLAEGRARHALAIDASPAALTAARLTLAAEVARGRAEVRQGDGLAGVPVGAVDCVVLAGLGGPNTVAILARAFALGHTPPRVVVQALGGEGLVRRALVDAGYGVLDEGLVADGERLFLTLTFDRHGGTRALAGPVDLHVGPVLATRRDALLRAWLEVQRAWLAPRAAALAAAGDPAAREAEERLAAVLAVRATC